MKRIMTLVLVVAGWLIPAMAQNDTRILLQQAVASINAETPMAMGIIGTLEQVSLQNDRISYVYMSNPIIDDLFKKSIKSDRDYKDLIKNNLSATFERLPQTEDFFEMLVEEKISYVARLVDEDNREIYTCVITPDEMQVAMDEEPDYKKLVEYQIVMSQTSLPTALGPITFEKYYLKGNDLISESAVDESVVDMEIMSGNVSQMRQAYIDALRSGADQSIVTTLWNTANAGYSTLFIYRGGQTGKSVEFRITPEEVLQNCSDKISL